MRVREREKEEKGGMVSLLTVGNGEYRNGGTEVFARTNFQRDVQQCVCSQN